MIKKSNLETARLALLGAQAAAATPNAGRTDLLRASNAEMIRARRNGKTVMTLTDRCWPPDEIQRAEKSGEWTPPGLAQRVVQAKTMKPAPSFRDIVRFDLEDLIVSEVLSDDERRQVEKALTFVNPRTSPPKDRFTRSMLK